MANDAKMDFVENVIIFLAFTILCILIVLMTIFFRFHIILVINNCTTIEDLEKKKNPNTVNVYDTGCYNNWIQVFGGNPWLWLLPVYGASGKPVGDGVSWNQKNSSSLELQLSNMTG